VLLSNQEPGRIHDELGAKPYSARASGRGDSRYVTPTMDGSRSRYWCGLGPVRETKTVVSPDWPLAQRPGHLIGGQVDRYDCGPRPASGAPRIFL
jgi:hypothetical protein